jgi:hypothetical protein
MLAAHMSKEFESIVESSLKEEDEEDENDSEEGEMEIDDIEVKGSADGEQDVFGLGDEESDEMGDITLDLDAEESDEDEEGIDLLDLDTELALGAGEEEEGEVGDLDLDLGLELPVSMDDMGGEEVMDLTGSSDDEVVKVFKKLSDDDEVEVVKDADGIHLTDNETGAEYYIKESMEDLKSMGEGEHCTECGSGSMYEDDELMYEIELDEDSDLAEMWGSKSHEDKRNDRRKTGDVGGHYKDYESPFTEGAYIDEEEEEQLEEDRTLQRMHGQRKSGAKVGSKQAKPYGKVRRESKSNRKPLIHRKPKSEKVSDSKIMVEYRELKSKNEEYKKALNVFKDKLNEVALFNTNLAYVNRLFTEHSTTKKEKMDILKRFDNAESIKESKNTYKTVKVELDNKKPINESIEKKVNRTIDSSKSTNLNESTAYVDPQVTAIKDLMRRIS